MSRRKEFFPEVTDQQWNDWHWQVKNRIETVDELKKYIKLTIIAKTKRTTFQNETYNFHVFSHLQIKAFNHHFNGH